jgi:CheY-like chemotaxis protein
MNCSPLGPKLIYASPSTGSTNYPIATSGAAMSSYQTVCERETLKPRRQSKAPRPERRSQEVLIVSSDHEFCSLVRSYLQASGLQVFTCSSPDRAEATFMDRCEIDLTLIDVQSLGIGAVLFALQFNETKPEVPILIIEGARPDESVLSGFFLNDGWTTARKPVKLPALLATIHRLLAFPARLRHRRRMDFIGDESPSGPMSGGFEKIRFIDARWFGSKGFSN